MTISEPAQPVRRQLLAAALVGTAAVAPLMLWTAARHSPFDRAAYDRYVRLMNEGDPRFMEYYAEDVKFVMQIRGRAAVERFYARQRPYVRETIEVLFFCSDATGAAAELHGQLRCIRDCDDPRIFGRTLKAGEVQRTHGYLLYALNAHGKIAEIKAPPPDILQPWKIEAA